MAQDLKDWLAVPPHQAGIVLSFGFPISEAHISSGGKIIARKTWDPKQTFVWQLRAQPDVYQIQFEQGPLASVGVIAKQPGSLTYLRSVPVSHKDGQFAGVDVAVTTGQPPAELIDWLQNAGKVGIKDAFVSDYIETVNRVLLVSTEPPWPSPPPPPKK